MPRVEADADTPVTPVRVRAALIDFSPDRPKVWPGIDPSMYEVYEVGPTTADIREGSKAPGVTIWAREHYDWTDPQTVTWTVRESNSFAPGSWVSATVTPGRAGGAHLHVVWNRTPTTLVGRILTLGIVATRGAPVMGSLKKGLTRLEQGPRG